jgi:hypothetical protein
MSNIQRIITSIVPKKWAESMEAESRSWMLRCTVCGFERSIWDIGGIRWKATPKSWLFAPCSQCGRLTRSDMYRKQ